MRNRLIKSQTPENRQVFRSVHLIALLLPWLSFFTMGKILQGILCLLLQITVIGWLPASIWALVSVGSYNADKRTDRIVNAMQAAQPQPAVDPRRL